ncbi:MAG: cell division protein FtsZ [Chitinophagales bacterium]
MEFENQGKKEHSKENKKEVVMEFDLPKEQSSIIKVIGVGGGGSNAVNHMFEKGIHGVNFVICNTDAQALEMSAVPNKIQLGPECTEGLGAGSDPTVGRMATEESLQEVKHILEKNTKMVFVTAGMGGGTGTGGAPVVAKLAKDMGLLTVAIVTNPFFFEGSRKIRQAKKGIEELQQNVDSIIIISNDKIRDIYGNLSQDDAFGRVDDIVSIAAKSISEIITLSGTINVDFADVQYVMKNSGTAIMGSCQAEGENRALEAIKGALESPLLDENNIKGAEKILLNITSGTRQVLVDEIHEINNYILEHTESDAEVIFGTAKDDDLGESISVTVIATGFSKNRNMDFSDNGKDQKKVYTLGEQRENKASEPFENPKKSETEFNPGAAQDALRQNKDSNKDSDIKRHSLFDQQDQVNEPSKEDDAFSMQFDFDEKQEEKPETRSGKKDENLKNENPDEEKKQIQDDFNDRPSENNDDDFFVIKKKENPVSSGESEEQQASDDKMRDIEQMREMKNLRKHYNDPKKLREMESTPAWMRKNVQLHNAPSSQDPQISRYNLLDNDDEGRPEIRRNNRYLHDKAD